MAMDVGAVGNERAAAFDARMTRRGELLAKLDTQVSADVLIKRGLPVKQDAGKMSLFDWLRFPQVAILPALGEQLDAWPQDLLMELEQDGRYAPYLARQEGEINEVVANERIILPVSTDYRTISGLSNEMVERLEAVKPDNLAAAARIRGITPAALAAILVHAKRLSPSVAQAA